MGLYRRRYQVRPGAPVSQRPTAVSGTVVPRGLTGRHWRLLGLLAEQPALNTGQVAGLLFGSRPAAVRHLSALVAAGLVWRFVYQEDPTHLAHYEASTAGLTALTERLHEASRPIPAGLGQTFAEQSVVNELLTRLVSAARASSGTAWLHGWRRGVDTALWLHGLGVSLVQPRGYAVWMQHGRAVRFLLHVDDNPPIPFGQTEALRVIDTLYGYRDCPHGIPASCLLMIAATAEREHQLLADIAEDPLPLPVAVTTLDRLHTAADPSEPIWALSGSGDLVALIDTTPGH
jgi:DNA-binding MarR family transcriptional regulator